MSWTDICALTDIPLRGARTIKTAQGSVAVFRTDVDEVFAVADRCGRKAGPLSEGIVHGQFVTCPIDSWVFDLTTGEAQGEDGTVPTYPVRVEAGRVLIEGAHLSALSAQSAQSAQSAA